MLLRFLSVLFFCNIVFGLNGHWRYMNPTGDQLDPVDAPSAVTFPGDGGTIYIFGGQTDDFANEVNTPRNSLFKYSIQDNKVTRLHPSGPIPAPRCFQSSWKRGSDSLYIFGGISYDFFFTTINVYNDFWVYRIGTNTWTPLNFTGSIPPLASSVLETTPLEEKAYLFGGVDNTFAAHDDLYEINLITRRITRLFPAGPTPPARYHAYHAPLPDGFFVTGGVGTNQQYIDDYWIFRYSTKTWTQIPNPTAPVPVDRTHGVTGRIGDYFLVSLGDAVGTGTNCPDVIFTQNPVNDTWLYSFSSNSYQELSPRFAPFNKYSADAVHGLNVYAFGGYSFDVNTCTQTFNRNVLRFHLGLIL